MPRIVNFARSDITGVSEFASILTEEHEPRLIELVRETFRKSRIKHNELTAALPEESCVVRYFRMPEIPKREQEAAIRFEARRYIPFKLEEVVSNYAVFKDRVEPRKMAVLIAATRNEHIRRFANILEQAGMKARSIDVVPFAVTRVFQVCENISASGVVAIAKIESGSLNIYAIKNGIPQLVQGVLLVKSAPNILDILLNQLRLSLDYYARQFPGETITKLFITGEGDFDGWDEKIHSELKVVVKVTKPVAYIAPNAPLPSTAFTGIGVALRQLRGKWPQFPSLSPVVYKPKRQLVTPKRIIASEVAALSLILILGGYIYSKNITQAKDKVDKIQLAIPLESKARALQERGALEGYKNDMMRKLSFVDTVSSGRIYWTFKLSRLVELLPDGAWIVDISLEDKILDTNELPPVKFQRNFIIKGAAYSETEGAAAKLINEFTNSLKRDPVFSKGFQAIEVRSIAKSEDAGRPVMRFEIVCHSG